MARKSVLSAIVLVLLFLALPSSARAQTITGVVKDASGASMPGVTVEAASPALIEKVKTAVSDGNGNYRITDLRPGTYTVTFTLPGFSTYKRDGLELSADFNATLNAELKVGALEETVTVTGESPIVDVSSTSRVQVLNRDVLDAIPTGRTIFGMSQLVTGVQLSTPDVGGSRAMQQSYMSTRGLTSANNIVQIDGLMINGLDGDGAVQQYINNQMIQEMSYTTAGAGADVSPGGVRVNVVMKDGGNRFNGTFFGAWNDGSWQSNNMTPELQAKGLRAADRIAKIYEFSGGIGGPVKRDKVWFFAAGRFSGVDAPIADTFYVPKGSTNADCQAGRVACEQGIDDQNINSATVRMTWQISPRNKVSLYYEEVDKFRGHGMNAGDDPETASQIWTSPRYNDAVVRYTSPISNKLLFEGGYSFNYEEYVITNQPGINKDRGTAEWYAGASRRDATLVTLKNGLANWGGRYPDRFNTQASMSYVTGSHNVKVGFQYNWGIYINTRETNADLQQVYLSGVPSSVTVYNTPLRYEDALLGDLALFAQDTWTLNRLTLNGGLRFETLKHEVSKQASGAGRFIGERNFDPIPMPTWKDIAPRFGAVYDLFGDAKTALKFGINRYNESRTTFFANRYNPLALTSASLSWIDANADDIAQGEFGCTYQAAGCEINFAQLPTNFGRVQLNRVDPEFKRVYNIETTAGIQHELFPRVSLSANYYRRTFHRLRVTDNLLRTQADYIPFEVFNPMTGKPFTLYDVSPAAQARVDNFDTNAGEGRTHVYNAFDLNMNARLPGGGTVFGGYVAERNLRKICDEPDDPTMLLYCDDSQNDIPYRPTLKLAGTYPLGWGLSVSGSFQSLAGRPLGGTTTTGNKISGPGYGDTGSPVGTNFLITRTTRYPTNCPSPCPAGQLVAPTLTSASVTVPLVAPGTEFLPRLNQLDLSFAKSIKLGDVRLQAQLDMFNTLNKNTELLYRSTNFATTAYLQPSSVLQGRMYRAGVQLRW
jgi:Carboxypeptidase regulatory-like domain